MAVNPHRRLDIYDHDAIAVYKTAEQPRDLGAFVLLQSTKIDYFLLSWRFEISRFIHNLSAPHVFGVAANCVTALNGTGTNQSILLSGESGAGKV